MSFEVAAAGAEEMQREKRMYKEKYKLRKDTEPLEKLDILTVYRLPGRQQGRPML